MGKRQPYEVTGLLAGGRAFKDGSRKVQRILYARSGKEAIHVVCLELQKRFNLAPKTFILENASARVIEEESSSIKNKKPYPFNQVQKVFSFKPLLP